MVAWAAETMMIHIKPLTDYEACLTDQISVSQNNQRSYKKKGYIESVERGEMCQETPRRENNNNKVKCEFINGIKRSGIPELLMDLEGFSSRIWVWCISHLEFLHGIKTSGIPNHRLKLRVGCPIMLMRNIDQTNGLCNSTRLSVTPREEHDSCYRNYRKKSCTMVFISMMNLIPSDPGLPFKFRRMQFSLTLCFVTINKSQGQSLSRVGVYLPKPGIIMFVRRQGDHKCCIS
ncbi:PIF1-like helicase [Medicago truncatula]|uniref:PIF1-like helicase n=1 Tax=Medicago truncatula TaxID=3880 RepID=G7JZK5_MEDTR|nr:PIF1-like helicase [Medicago truncatula]